MRTPATLTNVSILAAFALVAALGALSFWVANEPHDATIGVPSDYPTIEEAVEAAADGGKIQIAPGTYKAALDWIGKDLTIEGSGPDSTIVCLTSFFTGSHKDEAGKPTTPVRVELAGMTITSSNLLFSDTTTVSNVVINGSTAEMTGVVNLDNVTLHHNYVYLHGMEALENGVWKSGSKVTMTNVTVWDNMQFFFWGRNELTAQASILQEWVSVISGIARNTDVTTFHVNRSYTVHQQYRDSDLNENCWAPTFRNSRSGDYMLCGSSPIGPLGAQF